MASHETTVASITDQLDLINAFEQDHSVLKENSEKKPKFEEYKVGETILDEEEMNMVATIQLDSQTRLFTLHFNEKLENNCLSTDQENYLIRNVVYPCNSLIEKHVSHLDKHYSLGVVCGIIILCLIALSLVIPLIVDLENSFIYFLIVIPFILGIGIVLGVLFYFLRRKIVNNHSICESEMERVLRIEEERIRDSTVDYETFFLKDSDKFKLKLQLDYPNIRKISLKNTWKFLTDTPSILIYIGH